MYAVLVCTHKRGVGLAVVPAPQSSAELAQCAESLLRNAHNQPQQLELPKTQAVARFFAGERSCFATCDGLTAENLAQLYTGVLSCLGLNDAMVDTVAVAVGPGSFTGLRLGCAFANGLNFGRRRQLWALISAPNEASDLCTESLSRGPELFWGMPSKDSDDPFATQVSFGDLYLHFRLWERGSVRLVDVLEPHYGREPTPVLKLKQQEGNSLS